MPCPYPFTLTGPSDAIVFDAATPEADGTWWLLDDVPAGWLGASSLIEELVPAGGVGTVLGTVRKGSRAMAMAGACMVMSGDKWWEEANRLEALVDSIVTTDGSLSAAEPGGAKAVTVRYGPGQLLVTRRGNIAQNGGGNYVGGFTFMVPLLAAVPTKA